MIWSDWVLEFLSLDDLYETDKDVSSKHQHNTKGLKTQNKSVEMFQLCDLADLGLH